MTAGFVSPFDRKRYQAGLPVQVHEWPWRLRQPIVIDARVPAVAGSTVSYGDITVTYDLRRLRFRRWQWTLTVRRSERIARQMVGLERSPRKALNACGRASIFGHQL